MILFKLCFVVPLPPYSFAIDDGSCLSLLVWKMIDGVRKEYWASRLPILQLQRPTPFMTSYRVRSKTRKHTNGAWNGHHFLVPCLTGSNGLGNEARRDAWKGR